MLSTMLRKCLTAVTALAVLGSVVAIAPDSSAKGGPEPSPFAGTYVGADPQGWVSSWTVTISDGGQITSSYLPLKGTINGRVNNDGSYSFTVKVTFPPFGDDFGQGPKPRYRTVNYKSAGKLSLADGNIVGLADDDGTGGGRSISWLRQ